MRAYDHRGDSEERKNGIGELCEDWIKNRTTKKNIIVGVCKGGPNFKNICAGFLIKIFSLLIAN